LLTVASQSVLFFFAADILHLYLGADYSAPLATVLRISALAAVISAPSIVVTQYLLGIGKTKWLATLTIASGLVNLFGGIILVPKWGLQGAAWSDLCAIVLTRPFIHYLIWKRELAGQLAFKTFFSALYGTGAIALPLILLVDVFFQERTHPYELGHLIPLMFGSGALMGAFCVAVGLSFSLQREMYTKSSRRISEIFMKKFRGSIQTR
jgi:O-antigen/teichoic acid export membrane protein